MSRIQVYLPDDLHRELKRAKLSPSELLQDALRAELRRRELLAEHDKYLRDLEEEVGEPTRADKARAEVLVRRITRRRTTRRAG